MKQIISIATVFVMPLFLTSFAYAESATHNKAVSVLLKDKPEIYWDLDSLIHADVAWNKQADYVLGGRSDQAFILAIIDGANTKHYRLITFDYVNFFCQPSHILIGVSPSFGTEGYEGIGAHDKVQFHKTYKALHIGLSDDGCDPYIVTWNKKKKTFEWYQM